MAAATKKHLLKEEVRDLIDQLPDSCSMEDIHYQLCLFEKIRRGEEALKSKGGTPHQEVRKRLAKWRATDMRRSAPVRMFCYALLCGILTCAALASDGLPTTLPSTQPIDLSTPKAMMLSYDRLAGSEPKILIPFYATHDADEDRLVEAVARYESISGLLQVMAQRKWGNEGMNTVLHAFGEKTHDDIVAGKVEETGDRARLIWPDGSTPIELLKEGSDWKIDATAIKNQSGMSVDDYVAYVRTFTPVISDIADGIDSGKLATPAAVAAEVQRRLKALNQ